MGRKVIIRTKAMDRADKRAKKQMMLEPQEEEALREIIRKILDETKYDPIDLDDLHLEEEEMDEYGRPTDHDKIDEQDQDGDGDEDFADVMISRMTASGVDKKDAIKKTSRKKYNKKPAKKKISENLQYHVDHGVGVEMNVFRPGSEAFFALFTEARELSKQGLYEVSADEAYYINETDLGEYGVYEGMKVPLDYPMMHEDELDEAEYKGRDVELNKPRRGGRKKFYVYVKDPKTKNVKKVEWGSKDMSVKIADSARRKSFAARHRCKFTTKKDKATPRYWSCRTGRYPHLTGSKKRYQWW